jgi:ABC-2 type transport system permease protein
LAILLSQITWVPGLILFAIQAGLAGWSWTWSNLWIAASLVVSSVLWITLLCLLAMALSAWVKWRVVAGALLLAMMFFGAGFAQAINVVLRTDSGHLFNVAYLMATIWSALFQIESDHAIPVAEAAFALLAYSGACLALLMRKVRAYEVVR